MIPTGCRDCDELTSGRCWLHTLVLVTSPVVYVTPVVIYDPAVTVVPRPWNVPYEPWRGQDGFA